MARFRQRQEILLLAKASISAAGPTKPPVQCKDVVRSTASSFAVKIIFVIYVMTDTERAVGPVYKI